MGLRLHKGTPQPWLLSVHCVQRAGVSVSRRGKSLLSSCVSGQGPQAPQCCIRLRIPRMPQSAPLPRTTVAAATSLGTGSALSPCAVTLTKPWLYDQQPAPLLGTAGQSSRALLCEQAAAGQAANTFLLLWTGKKANGNHRTCELFKHIFKSWDLRSRLEEIK